MGRGAADAQPLGLVKLVCLALAIEGVFSGSGGALSPKRRPAGKVVDESQWSFDIVRLCGRLAYHSYAVAGRGRCYSCCRT